MARAKFGTHFKPSASVRAKQKKADKTMKSAVSTVVGVTAAVSHEVARQSRKNAKRGGASRAVCPEYAAAVRLAEEEKWEEIDRSVQEDKERRANRKAQKEAERAERLAMNPPKPPKSPAVYRVMGGTFVLLGLVLLLLFWPLGIVCISGGIWWIVSARKTYDKMVEGYRAVHPEFGVEDGAGQ